MPSMEAIPVLHFFLFSTRSEDDVAHMQTKSQYKSHMMMMMMMMMTACKGNKRITKIVVVSLLKYIKLLNIPGECYLIYPN
jgi:hypothetical protein